MNLNYTIQAVAKVMNAQIIGNSNAIVKQVSFDSRSPLNNANTLFFAIKGQKQHGHEFIPQFMQAGGKLVVVEAEQNIEHCTQLVVKNSVEALQLLAAFHRSQFNIPVIAIAGSNGKTTVKEWLYYALKQHFSVIRSPKSYNSQTGVPLSILEINANHQIAIIEAGISQPNEMAKLQTIIKPTIGVFTGIGMAHNSGFDSEDQKLAEKMRLFTGVDTLFTPKSIKPNLINQIPFNDAASVLNASLVKAVALFLGLNSDQIDKSLAKLPHISMRMEKMEGTNNSILINDTYTFDEKGLEIALQSISLIHNKSKKVLVLAPDAIYQPSEALFDILNASDIDVLVWIAPKLIPFELSCKIIHLKLVDDLVKSPLYFEDAVILFSGSRTMQLEKCIPLYQLKKHITQLEINVEAVKQNLQYYRQQLKQETKLLAMVKAQSYGSGSVEMARILEAEKVDTLGVAYVDEGVALRKEGITAPILVMNPELAALDDLIDYDLEPSIYSLKILNQFINQLTLKGSLRKPIHVKFDTGMHRLGFSTLDLKELVDTLNAHPEVYVKAVFSHLAVADNPAEADFTNLQIKTYSNLCEKLEAGLGYSFSKHLANTEAIVNYPNAQFDMVRLGIGLFGLASHTNSALQSAISFKTQISQIKQIPKGDTVGYGRRFKAERETLVGIVPVGYADGLFRGLSNGKWQMKVNDVFVPIIGTICMDMCMVDLTDLACSEGDTVEIFGWEGSIKKMAAQLNTIPYEIIANISARVHRVYVQ